MKHKLVKELRDIHRDGYRIVLIRDPHQEDYPYVRNGNEFVNHPLWRSWQFHSHQPPDHIAFVVHKFYAYADWRTKEWDILPHVNIGIPSHPVLFGIDRKLWNPDDKADIYNAYWNRHVPKENRAWAMELAFIHYDRIIAFDDIGDSYNEGPHLLVDYTFSGDLFERDKVCQFIESAEPYMGLQIRPDDKSRISFFPKEIPDEREEYRQELFKELDNKR